MMEDSQIDPDDAELMLRWLMNKMTSGGDPVDALERMLFNFELECIPKATLWPLVMKIAKQYIMHYIPPRKRIGTWSTLGDACQLLETRSKIMVITGAGISVSCGIPDFRSRDGIYATLLEEYNLPEPECMFDMHFFEENPNVFYSFAHRLWPDHFEPSPTHRFLALLERKGKLLRNYTQNIDNLETKAGVCNVIQCHGSFGTASCVTCGFSVQSDAIQEAVLAKAVPRCPQCAAIPLPPDEPAFGVMKPDIVFFGESLPSRFHDHINDDMASCDLCIVIGSSLQVQPVAGIIKRLPRTVPAILINREIVAAPSAFDINLLGECDTVCRHLCSLLGRSWDIGTTEEAAVTAHEDQEGIIRVVCD